MKSLTDHYYAHYPLAYVERAEKHLQLFDKGITESLFYAAFELRTGIESRMFEGLDALLDANELPPVNIKNFNPNKVFKKILEIDENAIQPHTLTFDIQDEDQTTFIRYTPVTKSLAKDWFDLSKLLHYRFFIDHKDWFVKKSLLHYRDIIADIAKRLKEASSGGLDAPPSSFSKWSVRLWELLNEERKHKIV